MINGMIKLCDAAPSATRPRRPLWSFLTLSPGLEPGSNHGSEAGYHGSDDDAPRADKRNDNEGHGGHTSPALPHSALRNVGWWLSCLGRARRV